MDTKAIKKIVVQLKSLANELPLAKNEIIRFEAEIEPFDILRWLANEPEASKVYWSSRDNSFEVGGIGLAYALHGTSLIDYDAIIAELRKYFNSDNKRLRFFG